jgi:large subunit ribosomal protein L21
MKYAVIQTGGKQYKVTEGGTYTVERLPEEVAGGITFSDVLLLMDGDTIQIGSPYVDGVAVQATILAHPRGEKIRVAKFKAKARYRRVQGHRQELSTIKIESIGNGSSARGATKQAAKPVSVKTDASSADKTEVKATTPVGKVTKKTTAKKAE